MVTAINDLELQKLSREKADLPTALVRSFDAALLKFTETVRFPLLRMLKVGHLLEGEGEIPADLQEMTFQELTERGTYQLCLLAGMDQGTLERLLQLLQNLAAGAETVDGDMQDLDTTQLVPPELVVPAVENSQMEKGEYPAEVLSHLLANDLTHSTHEQGRVLGSVEAEATLREAFENLRSASCYSQVQHLRVGSCWDKSKLRAPFIESMTFKQLAEMKIANLMEKRSFSSNKIVLVRDAIDDCLTKYGDGKPSRSEPEETVPAAAEQTNTRAPAQKPVWCAEDSPQNSLARSTIAYFEAEWARASGATGPLARIMTRLPGALTQHDFAVLWLLTEQEPQLVAQVLKLSPEEVERIARERRGELTEVFAAAAPAMFRHWETALQTPGQKTETLMTPYFETALEDEFQRSLCAMLLQALNGVHPQAFGQVLEAYSTGSPDALELVLSRILAAPSGKDEQLQDELLTLLPGFDIEDLLPLLRRPDSEAAD